MQANTLPDDVVSRLEWQTAMECAGLKRLPLSPTTWQGLNKRVCLDVGIEPTEATLAIVKDAANAVLGMKNNLIK